MPQRAERTPTAPPLAPRIIGHAGLWACAAAAAACIVLIALGAGTGGGVGVLAGLLLLPVAGLGVWLFLDFLRLADWRVAPELPLGLKLLGHAARVIGALAAAACIALAVLAIIFPGHVPPHPRRELAGVWVPVEPDSPAFHAARPGLVALFVLGIFPALVLRVLGTAVAEMRGWARLGVPAAFGGAVALLTVALVLNLTRWGVAVATLPLAVFDAVAAVVFFGLLVYFALPRVIDAFEADGL